MHVKDSTQHTVSVSAHYTVSARYSRGSLYYLLRFSQRGDIIMYWLAQCQLLAQINSHDSVALEIFFTHVLQ